MGEAIEVRDYTNIERYLNQLLTEVYPQPPDDGHTALANTVIDHWCSLLQDLPSILDVGCGQGQMIPLLQKYCPRVHGVTLGPDVEICLDKGLEVRRADMTFLDQFRDESYQMIFARHVLEHSPMPLLTLMEWYRVAKQWLMLIVPRLGYYGAQGQNHYSVLARENWTDLLKRASWHVVWDDDSEPTEWRWFCEKKRAVINEPERP